MSKKNYIIGACVITCFITISVWMILQGPSTRNCKCVEYECSCCAHINVENVLDETLCLNISYLLYQYKVSTFITFNDTVIFNKTVSEFKYSSHEDPAPICITHGTEEQKEICLILYDLYIKDKFFFGCAKIEYSFDKESALEVLKLGCFKGRKTPTPINWGEPGNKDHATGKNF